MKLWTLAMITELGDTHRSPRVKRDVEVIGYTPKGELCQCVIESQTVALSRAVIYSGGTCNVTDNMVSSLPHALVMTWGNTSSQNAP